MSRAAAAPVPVDTMGGIPAVATDDDAFPTERCMDLACMATWECGIVECRGGVWRSAAVDGMVA